MMEQSVKDKLLRSAGWPVYEHYEIDEDRLFVEAPIGSLITPDGSLRDPMEDALSFYAPLRTPELLVDLAALADKPITAETVKDWADVYGLLACSQEEDVVRGELVVAGDFKVPHEGRRDSVARFAEVAGEVRTCLRAYEALKREGPMKLEELDVSLDRLPPKALHRRERHKSTERPWLYGVIGRMIQIRIYEHCFPQFTVFTRSKIPSGRFGLGYGFHSLLGAVWLQMAWMLHADNETRCKLFDCGRVITIKPGEPASDADFKDFDGKFKSNVRGRYKTRKDTEFCKNRPCRQKYSYRKKAGWAGYA
jgi:hypothetical protein